MFRSGSKAKILARGDRQPTEALFARLKPEQHQDPMVVAVKFNWYYHDVGDAAAYVDLCNKQGIEMVVRVIPDPQKDIGLNILSLFHYRRRVRIVTCATLEEAMKALAT